jgi:putative FmdB family regulatory protein
MPNYIYKCNDCSNIFEKFLTISNRKAPLEEPCPVCSCQDKIELVPAAPAIGDPVRLGVKRAPSDFQKYVLGRMAANHPGSAIGNKQSITKEI